MVKEKRNPFIFQDSAFLFIEPKVLRSERESLSKVGIIVDRNSLKSELQNTLQSKLPELRSELGLSQEAFAELIGKSRQAVSLFERGELQITWGTCLGIVAVAVNRDPNVLMKLYGDEFREKFQKALN